LKIEEVKKLDDGVSGIIIEGRITRVLKPRESQYGWGQFIVIKDDTGEMGSNINIENEEAKYQGGEYVQVKGKVSKYVKNDKPGISLNGNVVDEIVKVDEDVSQAKPITQPNTQPINQPKEYTNNDYWHDKTLRDIENNKCIVRECAIKAVTELAKAITTNEEVFDEKSYFEFADKIVEYINNEITSADITKEFGGTKEERIEQAKEKVKEIENPAWIKKEQKLDLTESAINPHLSDPVNDTMATVKQKKQIYGYIDAEGKKIGGMVDSDYIKTKEIENIGKPENLTKKDAIKYWEYWYGKDKHTLGERDKRELADKEKKAKEENPLKEKINEKRESIEKRDPKDESSLVKDLLIEAINNQRKEIHLEDDEKFREQIGYNPKLEELSEETLLKLKALLKDWRPDWITK